MPPPFRRLRRLGEGERRSRNISPFISPSVARDIVCGAACIDCAIVKEISKKASVIELVNFICVCGFECFLLALYTRDGVLLAPWPLLC
jgi:hypothetical protein